MLPMCLACSVLRRRRLVASGADYVRTDMQSSQATPNNCKKRQSRAAVNEEMEDEDDDTSAVSSSIRSTVPLQTRSSSLASVVVMPLCSVGGVLTYRDVPEGPERAAVRASAALALAEADVLTAWDDLLARGVSRNHERAGHCLLGDYRDEAREKAPAELKAYELALKVRDKTRQRVQDAAVMACRRRLSKEPPSAAAA